MKGYKRKQNPKSCNCDCIHIKLLTMRTQMLELRLEKLELGRVEDYHDHDVFEDLSFSTAKASYYNARKHIRNRLTSAMSCFCRS